MKRITWTGNEKLEYTGNAPEPQGSLDNNDILLRVTALGLCSTDVHVIQGKVRFIDPPHVLGHEIAGVVEKTGANVSRVKPGDRVTVDSVVGCGTCSLCLRGSTQFCPDGFEIGQTATGGIQEYLVIPERNVYTIPDSISDEEAAIMDTEVFGALMKPGIEKGSTLFVIGPGPAGLVAVQLAKIMGAGKIILAGTRPERLEIGKRLGADITINVKTEDALEAIKAATDGRGADMVFEGAGSPASLDLAFDAAAVQGKVVLYGVYGSPVEKVNVDTVILKDLVLYGALSDRVGWDTLISWVEDGTLNLKELITHRFPFSEAFKAYETVRDRRDGVIKSILYP